MSVPSDTHIPFKTRNVLSYWCFGVLIMIIGMVVLGGYTRLTGSGLSMVDWRPITGFLPPLTQQEWQKVFALYQTSPEFLLKNSYMTVEDFKGIFWLEYIHRLWGRVIGLVFLVPVVYSFLKPSLKAYRLSLVGILCLGAAQGAMGWYMVKSGLSADPDVSPYRLCAHLLLAFLTSALVFWMGLSLRHDEKQQRSVLRLFQSPLLLVTGCFILLTIVYGAFVAGMKAGLVYNEFPFMGDGFIPQELLFQTPWYENFFTNPVTVQFTHRVLAISTVTLILIYGYQSLKGLKENQRQPYILLMLGGIAQVVLGISTLLSHVQFDLAVAHQVGALIVLLLYLKTIFHQSRVSHTGA